MPSQKQGLKRTRNGFIDGETQARQRDKFTMARWKILGTCLTREPLCFTSPLGDRALTAIIWVPEWGGMRSWDLARKRRPCFLGKRNILRPRVGTAGRLPGRVARALLQGDEEVRTGPEQESKGGESDPAGTLAASSVFGGCRSGPSSLC